MIRLSAVIITFNDEKNIGRCLDSLGDVVDEIVVVDSYSTDQTEIICRRYAGLRFFQHPFAGHIEQKNYALQQATFPYVLALDADEA
ncbi:MAG: glycosyltransferase, partial [Saprospiraceae bacterium]